MAVPMLGMGVPTAATATMSTSPTVGLTSVLICPANPNRLGLYLYNNSANTVYLTYGPVAAGNNATSQIATFTPWSMAGPSVYTGQISAIRNTGTGTITITELTA